MSAVPPASSVGEADPLKQFGRWVQARRAALALTRPDLAARVGCSVVALRKVEDGSRRPSVEMARQIVAALDVTPGAQPAFIRWARGESGAAERALCLLTPEVEEAGLSIALALPPLPTQPTSFVGRAAEMAAIQARLRGGAVRLLTLIGPGGVGKTRLALQAAADLRPAFLEDVAFVRLAALTDPARVPSEIARVLGIPEVSTQPGLASLQTALAARHMLLILDNLEQLPAVAPQLGALLAACPHLSLLATSREPLRLPGEATLLVPPLAVPDAAALPPLDDVAAVPAVALFVARAQAARPEFGLTVANAATVAAICTRLDGLPLALELAAARIRLLSPEALLARLTQRVDLLVDAAGHRPARHQTLRATLAWSYDLLDPPEQAVFRRLAVFAGGATLEAAEAVAGYDGALDCLALIESLVEKSLLTLQFGAGTPGPDSGEPRATMLETIREYALSKLRDHGDEAPLRQVHAAYFLAWAETAEPQLEGAARRAWLDRLEAEHDNFRAALDWALEHAPPLGLRLAGALWPFWWGRGHWSEGRARLAQALTACPDPTTARAKALQGAGTLAYYQGDYVAARPLHEAGLALYRELGDRRGIAALLVDVASYPRDSGDLEQATALLEESLALYQAAADRPGQAWALLSLGAMLIATGVFTGAEEPLNRSLALYRALGSDRGIMWVLNVQGEVARHHQKYILARELYSECVALCRKLGDSHYLVVVLHNFGHAQLAGQHPDSAQALFLEGLQTAIERHATVFAAWCLTGLGAAHVQKRQARRAARLFGAAYAILSSAGASLDAIDAAVIADHIRQGRSLVSPEDWEAAWAAGAALTPVRALHYAQQEDLEQQVAQSRPARDTEGDTTAAPGLVEPLTRRERDVLRLIAAGLSNDQVAARLCISINTVETHTRAIYGKLGVASRTAATRAALDYNLV